MSLEKSDGPTNKVVKEALDRLIDMFKNNKSQDISAPKLSHYRELPADVQNAYTLLHQGASMVHSTSTKYTLVGKISMDDQKNLASDLLRGCEIIGAATHVLLQDASGCSRAVRHSAVRASLGIFINVNNLIGSFVDHTAMNQNVGAQKTGAVWESCNTILNKVLPQGNRTAIRREIFTLTREIQDTMEEFQEMIDLGPAESGSGDVDEAEDDDVFGDDEQYSEQELPVATVCLQLMKTSRGTMKLTLETCDDLGQKAKETQDQQFLDSVAQLYDYARDVGDGVTDLGSVMYSPISTDELEAQFRRQLQYILTLQDFVLGLDRLPKRISELSNILRNAAETRQKEFSDAIQAVKSKD